MKVYLIEHVKTKSKAGCFESEEDAKKYTGGSSQYNIIPLEVEPSSKKAHPEEWKPSSQNYKQALLHTYKAQDLTPEDFADTLSYFEKLVREEAQPQPIDMKEKLKDGYTVVYRNRNQRIVKGDMLLENSSMRSTLCCYNDKLDDIDLEPDNDILSIRNENNIEIWKRNEQDEWLEVEKSENLKRAKDTIKRAFAEARLPIGLLPKNLHTSNRIIEIAQAIIRYSGVNKTIPSEWITELRELTTPTFEAP